MLDFGYYNIDCMYGMKQFPDKYFDLAIVDPPYFTGPEKRGFYGRKVSPIGVQRHYEKLEEWSVPGKRYFEELARVSKNQIVWGCNYYDYPFPPEQVQELKKRDTAKKPAFEGDGYDDKGEIIYDTWICPNCETKYEVDYDDYDFCPNCGQRLMEG